jgi:hypothetical protein
LCFIARVVIVLCCQIWNLSVTQLRMVLVIGWEDCCGKIGRCFADELKVSFRLHENFTENYPFISSLQQLVSYYNFHPLSSPTSDSLQHQLHSHVISM